MADRMSKKARSRTMSKIRSKNTKIEMIIRKTLWKKGYRYRVHTKLKGKPDIVFPKYRMAIFIDGCFWHKCPKCYKEPQSNRAYWIPKIERNAVRDKENEAYLKNAGWKIIRIWEHEVKKNTDKCIRRIERDILLLRNNAIEQEK